MGGMIGFVGMSHLGIVSSAAAAARGFGVIAHDADEERCAMLRRAVAPIHEPGLEDLIRTHRDRLHFTSNPSDLARCDLIVVALDVPTDANNRSNHAVLDILIDSVKDCLAPDAVMVILSQVPPGWTRRLAERLRCPVFSQVETLVFGQAVDRAVSPERIIVGCADPAQPLPDCYARFLSAFACPVLPMRYESAELTKTAINLFLVASVSTTNTLAELCEAIGADWSEIAPALRLDRRIGPHAYLTPGLGIAGGNLERDLETLHQLAGRHGTEAGIIPAFQRNSSYRRDWVLRMLHRHLPSGSEPPVIALWGLAYKPHTRSIKNSPALDLIRSLSHLPGSWVIRTYDPEAELPDDVAGSVVLCPSPLDACQDSDALVVMTPWPIFAQVPLQEVRARMRGRLIVDPFNCLTVGDRLGLNHHRLGGNPGHWKEKSA